MPNNENSEITDVQQQQQEEEQKVYEYLAGSGHCTLEIPSTEQSFILKQPEKNKNIMNILFDAVTKKEEVSMSVPSPAGDTPFSGAHFVRKFNWDELYSKCKNWLKHPMNIGFLIWFLCVGASLMMLGLLLIGALNNAFPTKSLRNRWIEINNQVLNGLFTLMSLFEHPDLFHHLFLLCRWTPEDVTELRNKYCKNGMYRPHEWVHITVVVVSFHVTCFSQYTLCGLYWGYNSKTRPEFWENFFFILGLSAPVFAGLYMAFSPLGRESKSDSDSDVTEAFNQSDETDLNEKTPVVNLNWNGGLFNCTDDPAVWSLSFFCTCCMFGWNMQRLGFGNMYVHMFTLLLLCIAPFWVLNITALNIKNLVLSDVIGYTGIFFCFYGLLYGGFWRIQMRKKLKLEGNKSCCRSASLSDYMQWLFCWSCALAQEIRTGNSYVEDERLYRALWTDRADESRPATIAPDRQVMTIRCGDEAVINVESISSSDEVIGEVPLRNSSS